MNDATRLADWVRTLRELARRAENESVLSSLEAETAALRRDAIHLVVAGGPNAGKSSRINTLLGRNLLPVTTLRSTASIAIQHGDEEGVVVDGHMKPLSALSSIHRNGVASEVGVSLRHDWLEAMKLRILERPPLEAVESEIEPAIQSVLRGADVVVLAMDALMPLTRVEAALLAEGARRELPFVIVLSKMDHLSDDERTTVLQYVGRHVAGAGMDVPLIEARANDGGDRLRNAIEVIVASADFESVRRRQAREALFHPLSQLELCALGALDAQKLSDQARRDEVRRKEQKLESQTLAWMQIEQRLTMRRQNVDDQVREYLATHRASALEALTFELERTSDVQQWWTRDLAYRLHRELRNASAQVSSSISRQVASDVRWLQEELHRQFKFPLAAPFAEPPLEVEEVNVASSPGVTLSNMERLRIVSRIGTAATVVVAAIALAHTGIAGATFAMSSLAGIAAEQWSKHVAAKDRTAVRAELDRTLQRAWLDLAAQVSAKLKSGYDDLVATLKKEQQRWHESQLQALQNASQSTTSVDWHALLDQVHALAADIEAKGVAS